jgi:hypothetical protein
VVVIGVDEHVWRHTRHGGKYVRACCGCSSPAVNRWSIGCSPTPTPPPGTWA